MKPFLKWAGIKQSINETILENLPDGERPVEPFASSGAIFVATVYDAYLRNDVNADLYRLFTVLKEQGPAFIETSLALFDHETNTEERYYELRDEFNDLIADVGEPTDEERVRRAALFLESRCTDVEERTLKKRAFVARYRASSSHPVQAVRRLHLRRNVGARRFRYGSLVPGHRCRASRIRSVF